MAKKSLIIKSNHKVKYSTQSYTRCKQCGRSRSVYKKFKLCRICFRNLANNGQIPGIKKASW